MQTDGGGEFKSYGFQKHLSQTGILQQMSCAYTLEQNGVIERRHGSIVEVAYLSCITGRFLMSLRSKVFRQQFMFSIEGQHLFFATMCLHSLLSMAES